MQDPKMTKVEIEQLLGREFPQAYNGASGLTVDEIWYGGCRVRQGYQERLLRPGGTISGPTLMALADFGMYVAIFSALGPLTLAVTTNLNINFLRKPAQRDLLATATLVKIGGRLVVGEVRITSDGAQNADDLVAHATATYSIPPR